MSFRVRKPGIFINRFAVEDSDMEQEQEKPADEPTTETPAASDQADGGGNDEATPEDAPPSAE